MVLVLEVNGKADSIGGIVEKYSSKVSYSDLALDEFSDDSLFEFMLETMDKHNIEKLFVRQERLACTEACCIDELTITETEKSIIIDKRKLLIPNPQDGFDCLLMFVTLETPLLPEDISMDVEDKPIRENLKSTKLCFLFKLSSYGIDEYTYRSIIHKELGTAFKSEQGQETVFNVAFCFAKAERMKHTFNSLSTILGSRRLQRSEIFPNITIYSDFDYESDSVRFLPVNRLEDHHSVRFFVSSLINAISV